MDFQSLKRRDLQTLCKKNNIQANLTNAAMADALASLPTVEGVEEFFGQSETGGIDSPERSVITSPKVPRTSTRQRVAKEVVEGSRLATRTRCGTGRQAVQGTDVKQTSAIGTTTRRRAPREAPVQRKMDEDMQAEFEANLEQSDVSENNGVESTEISEVDSRNESRDQHYEKKEALEEDHVENEAQDVWNVGQKFDFHKLSRRELQNLCKKNKIPANLSNAAMADALDALETVEGLEDCQKECDPLSIASPKVCEKTSTRLRQTRTSQKTAQRKPAMAGSAFGKIESAEKKEDSVVLSLAKKMDLSVSDNEYPISIGTAQDVPLKECLEQPEVPDCDSGIKEEVSDESDSSVVVETRKELQGEVVENKFDVGETEHNETEFYKSSGKLASCLGESNICDDPAPVIDQTHVDVWEQKESNLAEDSPQQDAIENEGNEPKVNANYCEEIVNCVYPESKTISFDEPNIGKGGEARSLSEGPSYEFDTSLVVETRKEFQDEVVENQFDEEKNCIDTEACDSNVKLVSQFGESNIDAELKPVTDQIFVDVLWQNGSNVPETEDKLLEDAFENMGDESDDSESVESEDTSFVSEVDEGVDSASVESKITCFTSDGDESDDNESLESETRSSVSEGDESDDNESLESENIAFENEGNERVDNKSLELEDISFCEPEDGEGHGFNIENLRQIGDEANEIDGIVNEDLSAADSSVDYEFNEVVDGRGPTLVGNCASEEENLILGSTTEEELSSLASNSDVKPESCRQEVVKFVSFSDAAVHICPVEQIEGSHTEDQMTKFCSESIAQSDEHAPEVKSTPLCNKSLRKLKMMLKEKLQGATLLASKMEKLTLEDNEISLRSSVRVAEPLKEVPENLKGGCEEIEASCDELSTIVATVIATANDYAGKELKENINTTAKPDGNQSVNVAPQCHEEGEKQSIEEVGVSESNNITCPKFTPSKSSRKVSKPLSTPNKSAVKAPMSMMNHDLDVNKENTVNSAGAGKTEIAVIGSGKLLSSMSMGKSKEEFKVLQQSDKRRPALQSRSENQFPLASP